MYIAREYQERSVLEIMKAWEKEGSPFCAIAPTGSGKSVIIAELCHRTNEPTLILQPTKEILEQNYAKLISYGVKDVAIYSASMKSKERGKFTYATIGSIYKKPELFKMFKQVILDEAHSLDPKNLGGMYNTFFKAIDCKKICGLTATPYRVVKYYHIEKNGDMFYTGKLSTINRIAPFFFKKFVHQITIQELQKNNFLAPLKYRYYNDFDISEVKLNTTGVNFDEDALERFWSDKRLKKMAEVIHEIDATCRHNLVYCSSIRQAYQCCEMLRSMGLNAEYVYGTDPDRDKKIQDFREGRIKHMMNVKVLNIGFDFPALDSITLGTFTMSLALLYQQCGRGFRIDPNNPDKVCMINDLTNNTKNLGRIETIQIVKEPGSAFKDIVITEIGEITRKPLFKFKLKDQDKIDTITGNGTEAFYID